MPIEQRVGARLGLVGNPSDGFGGKTISTIIDNFWAAATLRESRQISIGYHQATTVATFQDRNDLRDRFVHQKFDPAHKLVVATCKKFWEYCSQHNIEIADRNFQLRYESNIPRQVGLGGSSAIITATFKALMDFFQLTETDIPQPLQPNIVLSVETEELGIWAGLQDRVVQVYGGTVYMDFNQEHMNLYGHGSYENLDISLLPPLFLAYRDKPTDSDRPHIPIHKRYQQGDKLVIEAMNQIAQLAKAARQALLGADAKLFGQLMDKNFDLRRSLYGDDCLGPTNLQMIALARDLGLPAKFPGSGGAIIGICTDDKLSEVQTAFQEHGYTCGRAHPVQEIASSKSQSP